MERELISDSQPVDWVPDSQQPESRVDQHISDARVALFAVIVLINSLVELVCQPDLQGPQLTARPRSQTHVDGAPFIQSESVQQRLSTFMLNTLTALRVLLISLDGIPPRSINCQWYCKPRTIEWFYLYIDYTPERDPQRFREFFRISPELFYRICDMVRIDMTSHSPACFDCLPNRHLLVERQVAIALRRLSTGDQLLGIAELFGLSKPTASRVTWKFIQAFCMQGRGLLTWPVGAAMDNVKAGFQDRWGFPNCCGAIDVTHILIERPAGENAQAYYDWKHNLSITMQAIVDNQCRFLDVFIGNPGSIQDSRVLRTSGFYHNVVYDRSKLNGEEFITPSGYRLREYLLGDAGYPLYNWLIVPFTRGQSEAQDIWNRNHSSARMCVERAFGRLKGMWRLLSRVILNPKIDRLASTVHCCVLLHNLIIASGEEVAPQVWTDTPPHPEGYGAQQRRSLEMFDGGQQARRALMMTTLGEDR